MHLDSASIGSMANLSTLGRYEALDRAAGQALYELVQLAIDVCDVDQALVGLLDADGQRMRTMVGMSGEEAALHAPLGMFTLLQNQLVMEADVRASEALADLPATRAEPGVRFFAGVPLRFRDGGRMGVLCVFGSAPRAPSERLGRMLNGLARQMEAQIQLQKRLDEVRDKHLEHLDALQTLKGLLRAATTFAIMGSDRDGVLTSMSRGAERMLNVRAEDLLGRATPLELLDAAEIDARGRELSRELGRPVAGFDVLVAPCREGAPSEREWTLRRQDATGVATTFAATLAVAPVIGEQGEIKGYVLIAQNVEGRRAIERMKDDFIAIVSHELRTPLTSILGALGLAAGGVAGPMSDAVAELVQIAHTNSERLLRLVNDILDLRKLETGALDLELSRFDLGDVVTRAVGEMNPFAQRYGVHVEVGAMVPARVEADFDRLVQVVVNLVSNAVKFSPRTEAVIVSLSRRGAGVRLSVADAGPGIPESFRPDVFRKFAQASAADGAHRGGTGLGLSIVKSLVQLHRGEVTFETAPGHGTIFHVDLTVVDE
jgi:signal transduction histidine kinase